MSRTYGIVQALEEELFQKRGQKRPLFSFYTSPISFKQGFWMAAAEVFKILIFNMLGQKPTLLIFDKNHLALLYESFIGCQKRHLEQQILDISIKLSGKTSQSPIGKSFSLQISPKKEYLLLTNFYQTLWY
jgi:hypothetical protein